RTGKGTGLATLCVFVARVVLTRVNLIAFGGFDRVLTVPGFAHARVTSGRRLDTHRVRVARVLFARVNLFVLTMLGKTELVKPVLEAYPKLLTALGPHGFTLLHHAKVGGEEAKELYTYLEQRGLTEVKAKIR
nr:hypothetical protein [Cyclobacteriaceae bacterium]